MNNWSINHWNFEAALCMHTLWVPATPAPAGFVPSIEGAVPVGSGVMARAMGTKTQFDGSWAGQLGHDIGFLIPHVTIPPANLWLAKCIPLSKAKVMFARSTVLVEKKPAGAWFPGLEMLLVCGDPVDLPAGALVDAAFRNTVKFTLTLGDFLRGLLNTAIDVGISYLLGRYGGGKWLGDKLGQRLGYVLGQKLLRGAVQLSEPLIEALIEQGWNGVLGWGAGKLLDFGSQRATGDSDMSLGGLIYSVGVDDGTPTPRNPTSGITNSLPSVGR